MKKTGILFIALTLIVVNFSHANRDRGSWKKTLEDKAQFFETNTATLHNILGSYPSSVVLIPPKYYAGSQEGAWKQIGETGELPPGWIVDHGTTGDSNIAHTSSWTGCYLTSQAFRVAFLRDRYGEDSAQYKEAYARADEVIHSIRILTLVSGQPGYLARGMALGHGISYEERAGSGTRDLWAQGAGEYSNLRYRGGPSHHNYDHVFRGLGTYYFVAADERQKNNIREIVSDMSNWAHLKNSMVVMHADGKRESTVLIGGWRGLAGDDRPSGGSVMALCGLKISYLITGNKRVDELYNQWVDRLGLRDPEKTKASIMGEPRSSYDDTDHLLGDLYLLTRLEKDPVLLDFYKKCVKDSWEVHKEDKLSWFNFVYRAVLGDRYGDPQGSLWNLQSHPTCRIFQPQMNSIRNDIEFYDRNGEREALHPLPIYERPSDNEYEWKGNPYRLDGWTSRTVSVYEISPHDPYIQFAADTSGHSYYSNTRGETWQTMEGLPRVNDFLFSPDYPWIAFAATDGGIYRTMDQGKNWQQVYPHSTLTLQFTPDNSNALYAIGKSGVYKSTDMGERDMGTVWRQLSGSVPAGSLAFTIDLQENPAMLYMLTRTGFYSKKENDPDWQPFSQAKRIRGFGDVDPIGGTPLWLRADPHTKGRLFRAAQIKENIYAGPFITMSDDGGNTWTPILKELTPLYEWSSGTGENRKISRDDLRRLFGLMREFAIQDVHVDRNDPNTWFGILNDGAAITHNAGKTWIKSNQGLDIPRVRSLCTPRHSNLIAVGTPAGMYVSRDQGATWKDTPLILNGNGATRSEIGGIGYLTAYWMGRYHGFISEEDANSIWWKE